MIERKIYMDKLLAYKDTEFIKVITGIRRCGKSSLLKLFIIFYFILNGMLPFFLLYDSTMCYHW